MRVPLDKIHISLSETSVVCTSRSRVMCTCLNHIARRLGWDCSDQVVHPRDCIVVFSGHKHDDSLVEMNSVFVTKIEHTNLGEEEESNVR